MMHKTLLLYPWDLLDEGIEALAERIKGWGVQAVSLAVLYHQAEILQPHSQKQLLFRHPTSRGYFSFAGEDYDRLKPCKSELLAGYRGDFLREAVAAFHGLGIEVYGWTVLFHTSLLARQFPDCALHNYRGEPSAHCLCPSAPEVFAYGLRVLCDIAAGGVDALQPESLDYGALLHGEHHAMQAFGDTGAIDRLGGLCFCPHCKREAEARGLEVDQLQRQVARAMEALLRCEAAPPVDEGLLQDYRQMRAARITQFYHQLRVVLHAKGHPTRVEPLLWMPPGCDPADSGVNAGTLAPYVDRVAAVYPDSPADVPRFTARARAMLPNTPLAGGVRLLAPHTTAPGQVAAWTGAYEKAGWDHLLFYNYAMAPLPFLEEMGKV